MVKSKKAKKKKKTYKKTLTGVTTIALYVDINLD